MNRYNFGNKLCSLREAKNMTQKDLAKKLDVSDKAISKWENGKSVPKFEVLEELCKIFETDIEDLLCLSKKDSDFEIERLRLSVLADKEKAERIKNTFISIMLLIVGLTIVSCIFLAVLYQ